MAKIKGVKWAQFGTLLNAIATTIAQCATKSELRDVADNLDYSYEGSTLILPSKVSIEGSTVVI